jgi:hypothetical protein
MVQGKGQLPVNVRNVPPGLTYTSTGTIRFAAGPLYGLI